MNRILRTLLTAVSVLALGFGLTACDDDSSQAKETAAKQKNYDKLVARQPAGEMAYSPTRDTINRWIKTWGKKNKLSYVYIQNAKGEYGYFVLKGLPVSYCEMLTPPETVKSTNSGITTVPAPGMNGTYSSGSGACNTYYGFDATTGAYLEFTIGMNQSFFLFDQPVTLPEFRSARQLGPTSLEDKKKP